MSKFWLQVCVLGMLAAMCACNGPAPRWWRKTFAMSPKEAAIQAVDAADPDRRAEGIALLAAAPFGGEEVYVRLYRLQVNDTDAVVRAACIKALGMHGSDTDAPVFLAGLKDPSTYVRWQSARALQRIYVPQAARSLIDVLGNDLDSDVRMAAAYALGQHAEPAVFDALVGALSDTDFAVTLQARRSLVTLTGTDMGDDPYDWITWQRSHVNEIFAERRPYVWHEYEESPGYFESLKFWQKRTAEGKPARNAG